MDEGDVEAAMQWSRRTGLWSAGDTRFLEFLRMLQVRGVQAHRCTSRVEPAPIRL